MTEYAAWAEYNAVALYYKWVCNGFDGDLEVW